MPGSVDRQVPVIVVREPGLRVVPVIEAYVLMSMVESATGILIFGLSLFRTRRWRDVCRLGLR